MEKIELTAQENSFLASMDLGNSKEGKEYISKYECDPCDSCGPDSCADCKGCAEGDIKSGLNPFKDYKLNWFYSLINEKKTIVFTMGFN